MHQARVSIDAYVCFHFKELLPFLLECISGSRVPSLFFVEDGAAIRVASTTGRF